MTGMTNVTKLASEPSGQEFLVFTLGDEEYGIDILKVQEIRGKSSRMPQLMPAVMYNL